MNNESRLKICFYRGKNWIKDNENTLVLSIGFILMAIIGFGLGVLYEGSRMEKAQIVFDKNKSAFANQDAVSVENSSQKQKTEIKKNSGTANIFYVASKSGTKYHLPGCPGAKQIKPENRMEFKSREEAESMGYKPASNCPELQK